MTENPENIDDFPLPDPEEMKNVAIGLITAAVSARNLEDRDQALDQYADDFKILTEDMTFLDWISLSSLLANCGGAMVQLIARSNEIPNTEMMEIIAETIKSQWSPGTEK